jgi:hypothetical protein
LSHATIKQNPITFIQHLKLVELLLSALGTAYTEDVESHSLKVNVSVTKENRYIGTRTHFRDWSALADSDDITLSNAESWRNVGGKVLVSLFVSVVLGNLNVTISLKAGPLLLI